MALTATVRAEVRAFVAAHREELTAFAALIDTNEDDEKENESSENKVGSEINTGEVPRLFDTRLTSPVQLAGIVRRFFLDCDAFFPARSSSYSSRALTLTRSSGSAGARMRLRQRLAWHPRGPPPLLDTAVRFSSRCSLLGCRL